MIQFAGTFHQDNHGEWVKCMTEGGKPCSRHAGGEHIAGANLEDALAKAHEDDDFGMGDDMVATPAPSVSSAPVVPSTPPVKKKIVKKPKKTVKKPAKISLKKTVKKAEPFLAPPSSAPSSSSPETGQATPSWEVKVDPVKHQQQLDEMIAEESHHYHVSMKPVKPVKGISEYKTVKAREHHFQELMAVLDRSRPIDITGSEGYHYDEKATLASVTASMFPGVVKSSSIEAKLREQSDAMWEKMTKDERNAVWMFTGSMYRSINVSLINGKSAGKGVNKPIASLHKVLSGCPAQQDMILYRKRYMSSKSNNARSGEEKAFYAALSKGGGSMVKTNFSSTTISPTAMSMNTTSGNETAYVIKVPKGTPGMYLGGNSTFEAEKEFLLDKGLTYKVVGVYERGKVGKNPHGDEAWVKGKPPIIALEVVLPDTVKNEPVAVKKPVKHKKTTASAVSASGGMDA